MSSGLSRVLLIALLLVLAVMAGRPYLSAWMFSATTPRAIEVRGDLAEIERSTIALFERVSPSVVQIAGRTGGPPGFQAGDEEPQPGATGTGFVWDAAGHVVTNAHVVQGAESLAVRFASGNILPARIVGMAPNYDLAVLRVSGLSALPPPIPVGGSGDLKVGQNAFAIGNPFGLDQSLTTGVISALKRRLPTSGGREIANVIQTDAAINPGNSGGPLLDSAGRLIGVNTAIFSPSGSNAGIGFAIPVDVVNRVVPELIRAGRVPTPGIGIVAGNEAASLHTGTDGIVVYRTIPGSPAERAGLRGIDPRTGEPGDIIVAIDGQPVRRLADLTDQLEQSGVGKRIQITTERDGRRNTVEVEVADVGRSR